MAKEWCTWVPLLWTIWGRPWKRAVTDSIRFPGIGLTNINTILLRMFWWNNFIVFFFWKFLVNVEACLESILLSRLSFSVFQIFYKHSTNCRKLLLSYVSNVGSIGRQLFKDQNMYLIPTLASYRVSHRKQQR